MIEITEDEARVILIAALQQGWTRITLDDVMGAAKFSDTTRDLWEYLRAWDDDYRIEQDCDDKAAAWFEEASY